RLPLVCKNEPAAYILPCPRVAQDPLRVAPTTVAKATPARKTIQGRALRQGQSQSALRNK
ncbi:hypothetical protein A2U01_0100243, partial [Trifolium medium]|nr:hypothetical protein [Trifolium medium]